jgi:uncharacterized protein (TIGR00369 family)
LAPRFGVDLAVDVADSDPDSALRAAVGRKADGVVDVTAKAPGALAQAVGLARPGGTIVLAGVRGSAETPGFHPEVEAGRLVCEMPVTDEVITVMGNMHGGCLSALCDHVLGTVMYPVMPEGYWAATMEFKIYLTAPVTSGTCVATARIISMTRRQAVVRIDVENDGRLAAVAQGTCTIVAPRRA